MSLIEQATQAMIDLHDLTTDMKDGPVPSPLIILGIQSDLVDFYRKVGKEMSQKFGAKERAYLKRKLQQSTQYGLRRQEKKTVGDSTNQAMLAVEIEYNAEIDRIEEFMEYQTFLKSLQNAIDYARTFVSFFKKSEAL
jgi:hypothetical protein